MARQDDRGARRRRRQAAWAPAVAPDPASPRPIAPNLPGAAALSSAALPPGVHRAAGLEPVAPESAASGAADPVAAAAAGQVRGLLTVEARQRRLAAAETLDVLRPPADAPDHVRRLDLDEHLRERARLGVATGRVAKAARAFSHLDSGNVPAAVRRSPAARTAARRRAR